MDYLGSDFNSTGSVIAKSELTAARLKRGECVTCGRKCFKKKFLKMIPIDDEEGKVVNGRCLNCNPLLLQKSKSCSSGSGSNNGSSHSCGHSSSHSSGKNRNRSKDRMSLGNIHNSNSNSNSNVLLRRSKSHQPGSAAVIDAAIAVADCRPATPRDVESFFSHQGGNPSSSSSHPHQQDQGHRRGSTSGYIPPKRTLSSPARAETTPATNYHYHHQHQHQHQHQAAATASHTSRAARSIGCETFSSGSNFNSSFNVATTPSRPESLDGHSIASSSVASVGSNSSTHTNANANANNITTRRRGSYHPPLSREGSLNSCGSRHSYSNANSLSNSNHSTTSSSRVASREELEQAALTLMAAAQEHGLMDINSALADSLNNIVNLGGGGGAGGDLRIHAGSGQQVDGGPGEDPPQHPQPPEVVESEGVLNRGGIFPMRYGRHIYTGSTRTLSSMSSIDEGDQQQLQQQFSLQHDGNNHNSNHNSNSNLQHQLQTLRMVGKSCRTLGSLSTIDGTEEDEINSLNGNSSGNLSHYSGTEASTIFTPAQAHNKGSSQEEKKDSDTNATTNSDVNVDVNINVNIINDDDDDDVVVLVDRQLTQLRDSVQTSSSPTQSIRAIESLLDFIASFFDPSPKLDLLIEHGAVELLVSAMGKYSKSPIVQARACEAVAVFAAPCGGDDKGYESQSSSQSSAAASTERRRKVLDRKNGAGEAILFCSMILHEETADVQVAALNAIRCLCEDCEENQAEFLKLDLIEPIIRAMENHRNEPRLQEIGSSVISVLANNPNNEHVKSAIGLNGGLPVILRAILVHLDDIGVVETCCRALCELTADDPCNVVVFLDTPESTNAVLNAMRAHAQNPFAQEMGCAILANLTSDADHLGRFIANGKGPARAEAAPCVLGDGDGDDAYAYASASAYASTEQILGLVIETILEAIQSFAHSPTVQTMGCAALSNLIDSNDTKMFVVDMGALDTLVLAMVLHKDNVRVLEPICHLLLLLAVRENHQHILAANPIELVRAAAEKFPDRCKEPANRLIQELGLN